MWVCESAHARMRARKGDLGERKREEEERGGGLCV